jgi:hypothetical protein
VEVVPQGLEEHQVEGVVVVYPHLVEGEGVVVVVYPHLVVVEGEEGVEYLHHHQEGVGVEVVEGVPFPLGLVVELLLLLLHY